MSIQSELERIAFAKTAIRSAIEGKGVTVPSGTLIDGMAPLIDSIETGGGGSSNPTATAKAVNFRDYDGTVLYSYTVDEAAALTELPPLPHQTGLICQGWNWSLDDIKAMGRGVEVGAMYITNDRKTRIYIHLEDGRTSPMLGCCPNGTVTVDWGDGTEPDTLTGTSTSVVKWTPTHEYGAAGDYVIKLSVDGSVGFAGAGSTNQYSYLLRHSSSTDGRNVVYQNAIQKVEIGDGVTLIGVNAFSYCCLLSSVTIPGGVTSIGDSAFGSCYLLSTVTIPDSVTSIGSSAFANCYSLSSVTIPGGVTSIGNSAFSYCYLLSTVTIPDSITKINSAFSGCCSLSSVTIPSGVTSIDSNAFYNCYSLSSVTISNSVTKIGTNAFNNCSSLSSVTIPDGVTSIDSYAFRNCSSLSSVTISNSVTKIGTDAFRNCCSLSSVTIPSGVTSISAAVFYDCHGVRYYDFTRHTAVPTLPSTDAFTGIAADCEIRVPAALADEWKTATNWATYAAKIVGV